VRRSQNVPAGVRECTIAAPVGSVSPPVPCTASARTRSPAHQAGDRGENRPAKPEIA
jgi:hypothetical protein